MRLFTVLLDSLAGFAMVVGGVLIIVNGMKMGNHGAPIAGAILIVFGFLYPDLTFWRKQRS